MPLSAAGTRPDPAVSVPSAKGTTPWATTTAEPEEEPPGTIAGSRALRGTGCGGAGADETGGELVEIGLSDGDRPGFTQPRHGEGIGLRIAGERVAAGGGRHAGHVDIVLHGEGHAPERTGGIEGAERIGLRQKDFARLRDG